MKTPILIAFNNYRSHDDSVPEKRYLNPAYIIGLEPIRNSHLKTSIRFMSNGVQSDALWVKESIDEVAKMING